MSGPFFPSLGRELLNELFIQGFTVPNKAPITVSGVGILTVHVNNISNRDRKVELLILTQTRLREILPPSGRYDEIVWLVNNDGQIVSQIAHTTVSGSTIIIEFMTDAGKLGPARSRFTARIVE